MDSLILDELELRTNISFHMDTIVLTNVSRIRNLLSIGLCDQPKYVGDNQCKQFHIVSYSSLSILDRISHIPGLLVACVYPTEVYCNTMHQYLHKLKTSA